MRLLLAFFVALMLTACAVQRQSGPTDYLRFAEEAIGERGWETGYRFLENVVESKDPVRARRAQELLLKYPELTAAAMDTFSPTSLTKTIAAYGEERGIATERARLVLFRVLASDADYQAARFNVDAAATHLDTNRRQQEEQRANEARQSAQLLLDLEIAAGRARFQCLTRDECQKAFSLSQIFVSENADMKIQVATDTIVETYNATEMAKIALKAVRIPGEGASSVIVLSGSCKGAEGTNGSIAEHCTRKMLRIYRSFPEFMRRSLRP
jgi:hypothetical protein